MNMILQMYIKPIRIDFELSLGELNYKSMFTLMRGQFIGYD